jgi:nitrate reductase NapA
MINRRDFLKGSALFTSASIFPSNLFANDNKIQEQYICNFSAELNPILIKSNLKDGMKVPQSISGKNLNVKSYHNLSYQNNKQRIQTPLLKMKDGKYDKNGTFTPISWSKAFEIMSQKAKYALKESGTDGVGLATSGNISIDESYALMKLYKAGFRSNNIFNTAHYNSYATMQALVSVFGNDTNNGDFYDINYTDTLISWGVNFAESYPALLSQILQTQKDKKDYKFINISTMKNRTSHFADINILIKPNMDLLLLNYLTRELIYANEDKIDWNTIKHRTIFAHINSDTSNDADRLEQWEISYYEYKKSLEKYTLEFVAPKIKTDEEDLNDFQAKLKLLAKYYIDQKTKATSIWSSGINKQIQAVDINIAIYSLHLLLNKHSRPGCSALSLSGQISSNGSAIEVGAFSNRLPSNRYTKYKEHRVETENIWRVPEGTLNPIASNDQMQLFKNIKNNTTKFLWIVHSNPYQSTPNNTEHIKTLKEKDDLFVVSSDCFSTISTSLSDLILPSSIHLEKHTIFGGCNRETSISKQYMLPYKNSMSTLWQVLEFSKFFMAKDLWGKVEVSNKEGLQSVKHIIRKFGYKYDDTLYRILFGTIRAKSYRLSDKEKAQHIYNSEVKTDERKIIGSDDLLFHGYQFYVQKYLFEEYRSFGRGRGYDLASYDECMNKPHKWPYIYNKSIYYRYNPINDIYASKIARLQDKYIFYGKMGSKQLPFGNLKNITDENLKELKNRAKIFNVTYKESTPPTQYKFQLTSIKTIEHWNTGSITMKIKELYDSLPLAYCYMNKQDMQKLSLQNQDLVLLHSSVGELKVRVLNDKRFEVSKGMIAIGNYDEKILINKITDKINQTYVNITKIKEDKNV